MFHEVSELIDLLFSSCWIEKNVPKLLNVFETFYCFAN